MTNINYTINSQYINHRFDHLGEEEELNPNHRDELFARNDIIIQTEINNRQFQVNNLENELNRLRNQLNNLRNQTNHLQEPLRMFYFIALCGYIRLLVAALNYIGIVSTRIDNNITLMLAMAATIATIKMIINIVNNYTN